MSEADAGSSSEKAPASPRADLITAAVLLALGIAVVVHAFQMPRFIAQSGTGLTAPGIVPGFHGTMIALLSVVLALRAVRQGGWSVCGPARPAGEGGQRLALAAALGVAYAGVMVGRVPFWAASSLFVFAFITVFEWNAEPARRLRRVVEAAAIGAGTGLAVTLVFEELFLLRLP